MSPFCKSGKKVFVLMLTLFLMVLTSPNAFAEEADDIGKLIEDYVHEHEDSLAGMAVSVFSANDVEYESYFGFSNQEVGIPVAEDTVFDWGSITKLTVWISVMQLWEQGKIDLNADIRDYLPEGYLIRLRYNQPITMIHLMNHQAGFEDVVLGMETPDKSEIIPLEEALFRYQPEQVYEPGTVTAYSNWGTALAGLIVERVSGEPFYQYVQIHLFKPIGIEHVAMNSDLSDNPSIRDKRMELRCYTANGKLLTTPYEYQLFYPEGSCASPLRDLRRFSQELLNPDSVWFNSPDTYYAMLSPTAYYGDTDMPLNSHGFWHFRCYAVELVGHGGNTTCSSKLMLDMEKGKGMVVMVNQNNESVFTHLMADIVFGKGEWEYPEYRGYLQAARSTYSGLLKVYRIISICTPAGNEQYYGGDYCVQSSVGDRVKICSCYADCLEMQFVDVIAIWLMLGWAAFGIVFSLLAIIWKSIACLTRRKTKCPVDWQTFSTAVLSLMWTVLFLLFAFSLLRVSLWSIAKYRIWSIAMLVLLCTLTLLCVWGIVSYRKCVTRRSRAVRIATLVSSGGIIANIIFWNLFMFWTI